jgi:hypothetical protein
MLITNKEARRIMRIEPAKRTPLERDLLAHWESIEPDYTP